MSNSESLTKGEIITADDAVNLVHYCSECDENFRISKLLFEHKVKCHDGLKISHVVQSLAETEMYYSSDSDCDYTIFVEVTKTSKSYRQHRKNIELIKENQHSDEGKDIIADISMEASRPKEKAKLVCYYCEREFAYEQLMKEHVQYRHIEEDGVIRLDLANLDRNKLIDCSKCSSTLKNFKFYRRHLKLRHNFIIEGMPFGDGDVKVKLSDLPIQMKFSNLNKGKKGPFKCRYCSKSIASGRLLKEHVRMVHRQAIGVIQLDWKNMEKYICPECSRQVKSKRNLRRHLRLCHNLAVQRKPYTRDNSELSSELTIAKQFPIIKTLGEKGGVMQWRCGLCNIGPIARATREIYEHQIKCHGRPRPKEYVCEFCSKTFYKRSNIILHLKNHTNARDYACDICGARFNGQQTLNKHKTFHLALRCNICNEDFTLKSEYKAHHRTFHKGQLKMYQVVEETDDSIIITNTTQEPKKKENIVFQCQGCGKEFRSSKGFKEHICQELGLVVSQSSCNACGKCFNSKAGLRGHFCQGLEDSGHIPFFQAICPGCKRSFKSRQGFKAHVCDEMPNKLDHLILSCKACKKTFKSKAGLKGHMCQQLLDSGEAAPAVQVCQGCFKEFKSKAGLKGHVCQELIQQGYEKQTILCTNCQKSFKSKKGFEGHKCQKGPNIACPVALCTARCNDLRSYYKHMSIDHNQHQDGLQRYKSKSKVSSIFIKPNVEILNEELGSEVIVS